MNGVLPERTFAGEQIDFLLVLFRPLLTVDETCYLLGETSPQLVTRRLDDGTLRGLDISAAGKEAGRRELRIFRYAVEHLVMPGAKGTPLGAPPMDMIFPHRRDVFRRDEVAVLLNCTVKHVSNLPLEGPSLSKAASQASAARTPRIYRQSLIDFLTSREIQP